MAILLFHVVFIPRLSINPQIYVRSATWSLLSTNPPPISFQENVRFICEELRDPKFSEYHIFFSNIVQPNQERKRWIEDIAAADEDGLVRQMQEYYGDYYAVGEDLLSLNLATSVSFNRPARHPITERTVEGDTKSDPNPMPDPDPNLILGVISMLLSMKKRPVIRYLSSSTKCVHLAKELSERIKNEVHI